MSMLNPNAAAGLDSVYFEQDQLSRPGSVQLREQPTSQQVSPSSLDSFLGNVRTFAGTAVDLDHAWGEIRGDYIQGGEMPPPPQPVQAGKGGREKQEPMALFGIGAGSVLAGALLGVIVYALGGNIAWALIAALAGTVAAVYFAG
jgi:hypothetical protein